MTPPNDHLHAIILLAHGSRDPLWRLPIEAVALRIAALSPETPVACAYIEHTEPSLEQAAAQLVDHGAGHITVFPLFLGMGKHARADVPELIASLQARYPELQVRLLPSAGEIPELIDSLARAALTAS